MTSLLLSRSLFLFLSLSRVARSNYRPSQQPHWFGTPRRICVASPRSPHTLPDSMIWLHAILGGDVRINDEDARLHARRLQGHN